MDRQKYALGTLEKAIRVLGLYTHSDTAFTLVDITKRTGYAKSTVYRILKTLEMHGFLRYAQQERGAVYRLGFRFLELGGIAYKTTSVRKQAAVHLNRLADVLNATILVGTLQEDHLFYIDKRESKGMLRIASYLGVARPPHYGALGMVLLASLEKKEQERLLKLYPLAKLTKKTITSIETVQQSLEQVRRDGYSVDRGEFIEGAVGLAVPIRDHSGQVLAALGAYFPEFQARETMIRKSLKELLQTAVEISREVGMPNF